MRRTEVVTVLGWLTMSADCAGSRRLTEALLPASASDGRPCAYRTKREICVIQRDKKGRLQSIKILQLHGFI